MSKYLSGKNITFSEKFNLAYNKGMIFLILEKHVYFQRPRRTVNIYISSAVHK